MKKIEKALDKANGSLGFPSGRGHGGPKGKAYTSQTVSLPSRVLRRHNVVSAMDPKYMDYYNLLRTQVLHRTREDANNIIMVTSSLPDEGATLTAINLAISIAHDLNQYCMVVDTHLRNPVINEYLGFKTKTGLTDYLMKDTPLFQLIVKTDIDKLTVLPAGRPITGSTELLGSPKMRVLVQEMKDRYPDRYVIFNCPPLLSVPDALVFSSYVDATLLVVEAGKTARGHVAKSLDLLRNTNVLGLVLNKAKEDIV